MCIVKTKPSLDYCSELANCCFSKLSIFLFLVDAVYAMAHSLHNLILDECCSQFKYLKEKQLQVDR